MFKTNNSAINWLLENDNPPVKYLTYLKILDMNPNSSKIISAKNEIMTYKPIKEILMNQIEETYWFDKGKTKNYKKYLGTFWQLIFLSEMQAEKNKQIANACEHVFSTGQAPNGAFSMSGTNSQSIICLTANVLRALIHFNYLEDDRTQKALEYILSSFVDTNGKIRCQVMGLFENCYMTIPKILFALSAMPEKKRTPRVNKGIDLCVKRLLDNQIYIYLPEKTNEWRKLVEEKKLKGQEYADEKKNFIQKHSPLKKKPKVGWTKFRFPLNNSDALDAMRALVSANVEYSSEMESSIELIISKNQNGKWLNEKEYRSPFYTIIEPINSESKWLTLHALITLKHFIGIEILDH